MIKMKTLENMIQ